MIKSSRRNKRPFPDRRFNVDPLVVLTVTSHSGRQILKGSIRKVKNCMGSDPLTIVAENGTVPDDQTEQFLDDVIAAVRAVQEAYDQDPGNYTVFDGHLRTQTNPHVKCPECREQLRLRGLRLDDENGANAMAYCRCGWKGLALYRLVDLKEKQPGSDQHGADDISHVSDRGMRVQYIPYKNTDLY